jgi:hypothetical protein
MSRQMRTSIAMRRAKKLIIAATLLLIYDIHCREIKESALPVCIIAVEVKA